MKQPTTKKYLFLMHLLYHGDGEYRCFLLYGRTFDKHIDTFELKNQKCDKIKFIPSPQVTNPSLAVWNARN